MLEARHLECTRGERKLFRDLSFKLGRGQLLRVAGANGSGKTSLLRIMCGLVAPSAGELFWQGRSIRAEREEYSRNLVFIGHLNALKDDLTALENLGFAAALGGVHAARARTLDALDRFGVGRCAELPAKVLSQGQRRRVTLARLALSPKVPLWILDEPFSGLDPVNQIVMKDIFAELKQQGKAIIFSTHQMETAEKLCDELCLINRGTIVLEGTVKQAKQRFGINSLHLEFDGDGKFLSNLPFVKKATVYENYAELSLNGSISSNEILSAILPKLELRKFEFVEPSLNTIFLEVVGLSVEEIEKEKTEIQQKQHVPVPSIKNPEIKKQQTSLVLGLLAAVVGVILYFTGKDTGMLAGVGAVVSVVSFIRLQKAKVKMKQENAHE